MMLGCLASIDAVNEFLFISGFAPVNRVNLSRYGINFVVDATNLPGRPSTGVDTLKVNVDDSEASQLTPFFKPVCDALARVRASGGKALVHCAAGISRSATLCIVYLMVHERVPLRDAFFKIHDKRPVIAPNNGFWRQMIQYEVQLTGRQSVTMVKTRFREVPDVYLPNRPPAPVPPLLSTPESSINATAPSRATVLGYSRLNGLITCEDEEVAMQPVYT